MVIPRNNLTIFPGKPFLSGLSHPCNNRNSVCHQHNYHIPCHHWKRGGNYVHQSNPVFLIDPAQHHSVFHKKRYWNEGQWAGCHPYWYRFLFSCEPPSGYAKQNAYNTKYNPHIITRKTSLLLFTYRCFLSCSYRNRYTYAYPQSFRIHFPLFVRIKIQFQSV